jgi:hypothetical protein
LQGNFTNGKENLYLKPEAGGATGVAPIARFPDGWIPDRIREEKIRIQCVAGPAVPHQRIR